MTTFISHRMVRNKALVCLFLAIFTFSQTNAQEICPDYPRVMDQVFVCYEPSKIKIDQNSCLHNPVRFTFPALPPDITVSFDAGDNNGPVSISTSGEVLTVTYTDPGQYQLNWTMNTSWGDFSGSITFQANFNNEDANYSDFLPHETWGDIVGDTYTPSANGAYPLGNPNTLPVTAGGIVHILYANPDHQMRKPFIFVEGFDPILGPANEYLVTDPSGATLGFGSVRWDVIVTGRSEAFDVDPSEPGVPHTPQFQQLPTLIQGLRSRGYDIVYVDFADAGTYIQANAEFLIDVIERVNNAKITDEETVLIGASMGGIVSRYALAKMEQDGKAHCVGLFGTLDTPHNGANIPLAVQAFGWHMHATGDNHLAWNAMDTPAARQQLIKHLGTAVQEGVVTPENDPLIYTTPMDFSELLGADYSILRNQLRDDLQGLGWPTMPRKIALLNGMRNGTLPSMHGYGPGDKFCEANLYADQLDLGTVFKIIMRSNNGGGKDFYSNSGMDNCGLYQGNGWSDNHLFTIVKPHDFNPCNVGPFGSEEVPYKYHVWRLKVNGNLPFLDNAPGGFRMDLRTIHHAIESTLKSGTTYHKTINFPISTFVPTWSGLAMGTELTNENLLVNLNSPDFFDGNLPNSKVPNFDRFYAPESNLRHVEIDGGMVTFIFDEIDRLDAAPQPGVLVETYNYGDRYKQIPNTTVSPTGVLNINNPGPTGYVQSAPEGNATKPVFTTYLGSCGQVIAVEAGGRYTIGALDKSQHGITEVWSGSTVHIKSGGILHITSEQSMLIIKSGAQLILDPGAIVRLESSGANIRIEGDLVVNGDINFQGLGFFDFGPGNRLVFGPGYKTFNLSGAGKDKRFVRLSADVIVNNANRLHWSNGLVEVGGTLLISQGAGLNFNLMTLQGLGVGTYSAVEATESGTMNFQGCEILNLSEAITGRRGLGCTVNSCTFSNNTAWGVYWTDAFEVSVRNSMFNGTNSGMALFMENLFRLEVKNSFISGHLSPIQGVINDDKLMIATPAINLYNVFVCLLNNSHFSGNTVAVKAADPLGEVTSSVIAYGGTSFLNHDAAIFVNGTATGGVVLADCTVFQDNRNGIRGRDITLMIDSKNTKNTIFDTDSPNRFIRDNVPQGGMTAGHVRICYELKAAGGSNLMRNNFWGISNGSGTPDVDQTPLNFLSLLKANCVDVEAIPQLTPVDSKNPMCLVDERPPSFKDAFPGSECSVSVSEGGVSTASVHEQFHFGAFLLKADSVQEAVEVLRPVAALWQEDLSGFPENCQQYIQVAKALVDGSDNSLPDGDLPRPGGDRTQKVSSDQLLIAPNPAYGSTLVYLSEASSQLSVWDANGTLMHQAMPGETATYRIEMGGWKPGIYLVRSINVDGRIRTGKIVLH